VRTHPWLSACVITGALAGVPALAQPAVTLRAALDAAWLRASASREADGLRRTAEAERAAAGALWAAPPSLTMSHRDSRLHGGSGRETEFGIAVPLWMPGQRTARADTADAEAAQALAAGQAARWQLAGELREAVWQMSALQAEADSADARARALQQLADDVQRRVRAGDLARADALAAQAEQLAASAARTDLQQRLQEAQTRWTLVTGLTAAPDVAADAAEASAPEVPPPHPALQLARQSTELARQRVALLRHSRRDAPELSVGVRQDAPGRTEGAQASLVVGLRLPFGTDDRNLPREAAALTELDVAQTHELRLRERLDHDIATARGALRSAQSQLDAETARARLLRERATLIETSFHAGETPLPDLLRALAAAAQADSATARQAAALGLARARLQQALGLLP
jgi:outer membrane protein TolC